MGCALRPNRGDCQDLSVVGSRNRPLALILVMRCPHRAEELFPSVYRVLVNRNTCKLWRYSGSEHGTRYLLRRSYELHTSRIAMGSIFWAEFVGSISRAHVRTECSEQELRAEHGLGQL
ncbi:hypothetical protein P8452_21343 [Trifolium repens]|nr:hypothetical protein QL285_008184 [Trifolium repens]KAK2458658.1 hypothetical protein QL285_005789 [Trifolium repens]WJX33096.1 hypothetical protein P8452_21343 [Trifolium repens]